MDLISPPLPHTTTPTSSPILCPVPSGTTMINSASTCRYPGFQKCQPEGHSNDCKGPTMTTFHWDTPPFDEDLCDQPRWIAGVGDISLPRDRKRASRCSTIGLSRFAFKSPRSLSSGTDLSKITQVWPAGTHEPKAQRSRTALQRHCDFWDSDGDGVIYPWDIYTGFRRLGFCVALCIWAAVTIPACASYSTHTSYLPHPLFAINLDNINSNRHGSNTASYDMDGELDERRFDAIFDKYAQGQGFLTRGMLFDIWRGQRCGLDFFGWFAGGLECKCSPFNYDGSDIHRDCNVYFALACRWNHEERAG